MNKLNINEMYRYCAGSDCTDGVTDAAAATGLLGLAFPPAAPLFAGLGLLIGGVGNWYCDQPSSQPGSTHSPGPHRSGPR